MLYQHIMNVFGFMWQISKLRLLVFLSLVGLFILLGGTDTQSAAAQNALPQFNLVGNAIMHEDRLGLTVNQQLHTGAAWLPDKQQVQDGFTAEFQWQINRVNQRRGAEGFAFVIHNADGQPIPEFLLGEGRHGLGYQGIPNSIAVEFDTVQTPSADFGMGTLGDPNGNHISVQTRGQEPNNANTDFSLGFTTQLEPAIPLFANGSRHTTKLVYKPGNLAIFLDDMTKPLMNVSVDLGTRLRLDEGKAWVGFTGATGRRFQAHDIYTFSFTGTEVAQPSVDIDIIPGSDPNTWPCQNTEEDLPVAILTTDTFDATTITRGSVRFGKTGTESSEVHGVALEDVNGDGRDDLVFRFRLEDTVFSCNDIPDGQESVGLTARLTGEAKGKAIAGEDTLELVR